jgi:TolA-binding protein
MPPRFVTTVAFTLAAVAFLSAQPPPLPPVGEPPPPLDRPPLIPTPQSTSRPREAASELELVERVIEARKQYANSLRALLKYYEAAGDTKHMQWAEDELKQFHRLPHYAYRLDLDVPNPKLQPLYNIPQANDLYRDAMKYKDRGLGTDYVDNQKRAEILLQRLLTDYPQSNKISDTAYQLGELYECRAFRQYERAAVYFERCFQWNPATQYDARLRAARVYDRELKNRAKALELYRLAESFEADPARVQEAKRRIADLNGSR